MNTLRLILTCMGFLIATPVHPATPGYKVVWKGGGGQFIEAHTNVTARKATLTIKAHKFSIKNPQGLQQAKSALDQAVPQLTKQVRNFQQFRGKTLSETGRRDTPAGNVLTRVVQLAVSGAPAKTHTKPQRKAQRKDNAEHKAPAKKPVTRIWTDSSGTKINAEFLDSSNGHVRLRANNGEIGTFPLTMLSEADQEWIRSQEGQTSHASLAGAKRTWTSSSGKNKVEAEFVEFKDGKVWLKKDNGKVVGVPPAQLSAADRTWFQDEIQRRQIAQRQGDDNVQQDNLAIELDLLGEGDGYVPENATKKQAFIQKIRSVNTRSRHYQQGFQQGWKSAQENANNETLLADKLKYWRGQRNREASNQLRVSGDSISQQILETSVGRFDGYLAFVRKNNPSALQSIAKKREPSEAEKAEQMAAAERKAEADARRALYGEKGGGGPDFRRGARHREGIENTGAAPISDERLFSLTRQDIARMPDDELWALYEYVQKRRFGRLGGFDQKSEEQLALLREEGMFGAIQSLKNREEQKQRQIAAQKAAAARAASGGKPAGDAGSDPLAGDQFKAGYLIGQKLGNVLVNNLKSANSDAERRFEIDQIKNEVRRRDKDRDEVIDAHGPNHKASKRFSGIAAGLRDVLAKNGAL